MNEQMGSPLRCLEIFHSRDSTYSASGNLLRLAFKHSYQFMVSVASVPGNEILVAVFIDVPISQILGNGLPYDFRSLMNPRKVLDFQITQIFLWGKMEVVPFKLFRCWS